MKNSLIILAIAIIWFFFGYLVGSRPVYALKIAQRQSLQFARMDQSSVLSADLHIANDLHQGNVEEALNSVVSRIDVNLISLAQKQTQTSDGINDGRIFNYALNFRKTNLWMNGYGIMVWSTNGTLADGTNSFFFVKLQKLLSKP